MRKLLLSALLLLVSFTAQAYVVGVASTITNGRIVLTSNPCDGIGGHAFEILDAFGNNVGGGCWIQENIETHFITAIDVSTMQRYRWRTDDFVLSNGKHWAHHGTRQNTSITAQTVAR